MVEDISENIKHLMRTIHARDPLDDARGNAEALSG